MDKQNQQPEPIKPPWDEWAVWEDPDLGPEVWAERLTALAGWVSWLQEAYRFVKLPPCWTDHEGLRIELEAFWCQWITFFAPVMPNQLQATAGAMLGWHDLLRRASADWQQRYAACEHTSVHIDQVGRGRQEFHERSVPFVRRAVEHEREARERWRGWSPISMDAPDIEDTMEVE